MFVDVIVPVSVPSAYTYGVPLELQEDVGIGKRVEVEFGKRKRYSAVIIRIHNKKPEVYEPKPVLSILDNEALITENQIALWKWMSQYYMANIGDVVTAALPSALRLSSESLVELSEDFDADATDLDNEEYLLFEALSNKGQLEFGDVSAILQTDKIFPILNRLASRNIITIKENLKKKYKPKTKAYIRLKPNLAFEEKLQDLLNKLERAQKQQEALLYYLSQTKSEAKWIEKKQFEKQAGVSPAIIKALVEKEIFDLEQKEVSRLEDRKYADLEATLSPLQEKSLAEIKSFFEEKKPVLLHGVTGSGKTHLYIKLIEEQIKKGNQTLYLLPEIALTSQIIQRLQVHFGNQVGVYHSRFNLSERVEIWNNCLKGKYKILVGARSALFLPFQKLGLVIVDEEHDDSFKQYDPAPRYHGRDAALWLAHHFSANTLLGSATPSFESYFNTQHNKYGLVELKERFGESVLPKIEIVNLNKQFIPGNTYNNFSKRLIEELRETVKDDKQAILFRNRRGYSSIIQCTTCAHVLKCENCDVSMTYHKFRDDIECHYCGFKQKVPYRCPACEDASLEKYGIGTQKVEEELNVFLPDAKFGRMDWDTTRNKHGYQKIIDEFEQKNIDILVGTQMVTKGLHFDDVRLVGILSADSLINFPDFRAGERALQLMEQVSGRAGRLKEQGLVIVQVRDENYPVLKYLINHDYIGYYHKTLEERWKFKYPPFYRQIKVTLKHKDWKTCYEAALALATSLRDQSDQQVKGPSEPIVKRIKNQYLQEILITLEKKSDVIKKNKAILQKSIDTIKQQKGMSQVRFVIDVDPVS